MRKSLALWLAAFRTVYSALAKERGIQTENEAMNIKDVQKQSPHRMTDNQETQSGHFMKKKICA